LCASTAKRKIILQRIANTDKIRKRIAKMMTQTVRMTVKQSRIPVKKKIKNLQKSRSQERKRSKRRFIWPEHLTAIFLSMSRRDIETAKLRLQENNRYMR
jgi:hypothetical protein